MSTSSLLAVVLLNPRALIAHWRESTCATSRFEAKRNASGSLVAPERRMSSWVITWVAEDACDSFSGRLETDVTSRFISCSSVSLLSAPGDAAVSGCWARPRWGEARRTRPRPSSDTTGQRRRDRRAAPPQAALSPCGTVTADSPTTESQAHIYPPHAHESASAGLWRGVFPVTSHVTPAKETPNPCKPKDTKGVSMGRF